MVILVICLGIILMVLIDKHEKIKKQLANTQKELDDAKKLAHGVFNVDQYRRQQEATLQMAQTEHREKLSAIEADIQKQENELKLMRKDRNALQKELDMLSTKVFIGTVKIDSYRGLASDEIKNQLSMLRSRQDEIIKKDAALIISDKTAPQKTINNRKKQILRCFNAECSAILDNVTVKNVDKSRAKIQRAFETVNKMFASDGVAITQAYLASRLEELSMIYACLLKIEEEKEQRRAIRQQMVEEEKVRREIEAAKKKLEKEVTQFSNEIKKLMSYMQKTKDNIERKLYIDKITELQNKLQALEGEQENVLQREQNTRAGFVYIISNIGSFGEHIFKIGMTRRLEPMDRIAELSSASVPFPFDVHAMIFSEDAPALETTLHRYFDAQRVNRVNPRKEFFKIDLAEIEKVVRQNHNATVKFVDIPDAIEYRETLKLSQPNQVAAAVSAVS